MKHVDLTVVIDVDPTVVTNSNPVAGLDPNPELSVNSDVVPYIMSKPCVEPDATVGLSVNPDAVPDSISEPCVVTTVVSDSTLGTEPGQVPDVSLVVGDIIMVLLTLIKNDSSSEAP